eukprot:2260933-Alexandrium_andersonii.AAC.1
MCIRDSSSRRSPRLRSSWMRRLSGRRSPRARAARPRRGSPGRGPRACHAHKTMELQLPYPEIASS